MYFFVEVELERKRRGELGHGRICFVLVHNVDNPEACSHVSHDITTHSVGDDAHHGVGS